jgi:hypothetical protein
MRCFLGILFLIFTSLSGYAQDELFLQKAGNTNQFNPALVGSQSDFAQYLNYRFHWNNVAGAPRAKYILFNYNFKNNIGMGLDILRYNMETSRFISVKININHKTIFKNIELQYGGNFGYNHQILQPYVHRHPVLEFSAEYINIDIGAAYFFKGLNREKELSRFMNAVL